MYSIIVYNLILGQRSYTCSAGQDAKKRKRSVACKRRRNQNAEIDELASLVPLSTPLIASDSPARSLVPSSNGSKTPAIDKISVLRLTSAFLKLQKFMKDGELTFTCSC